MDQHKSCIIFCEDDTPQQFFSEICITHGCRTGLGDTGCHISGKKNASSRSPCDPNNNSEDGRSEMDSRDNFCTSNIKSLLKSCRNCNNPGVSTGRDRNVAMRKSVSFDDDVMVCLFDRERPTLEMHSEPCTSLPSGYSCNQQDVTLEDTGLEWEDDFSALEKNCHVQCVRHSQRCAFSLPRPERFSLSPTCLFLTHVTESDLEL